MKKLTYCIIVSDYTWLNYIINWNWLILILFITQAKDERPSDLDENARTVINWYMNDWSGKAKEYLLRQMRESKKISGGGGGSGSPPWLPSRSVHEDMCCLSTRMYCLIYHWPNKCFIEIFIKIYCPLFFLLGYSR